MTTTNTLDSRELHVALARVFRDHPAEPLTSMEVASGLQAMSIHVNELLVREKLDGLVKFGSLRSKVLRGEEHCTVYWTKQLFNGPESDEIRSIKLKISEAIKARPSQKQQAAFEKEILDLQQNIKEMEDKLSGKKDKVAQTEPSALRVLALEKETKAIKDETEYWRRMTSKAIEMLHGHFSEASTEQILEMASRR